MRQTDAQKLQARKGALGIVSGVWGQYSVFWMSVTMPWTISCGPPDCAVPHCVTSLVKTLISREPKQHLIVFIDAIDVVYSCLPMI